MEAVPRFAIAWPMLDLQMHRLPAYFPCAEWNRLLLVSLLSLLLIRASAHGYFDVLFR